MFLKTSQKMRTLSPREATQETGLQTQVKKMTFVSDRKF